MSYTTNAAKDLVRKEMFVVLKPRKRVTSWTLHSGSVYYASFSFGTITGVSVNGTALTAGTSTSLSAGYYYQDSSAGRLYIRKSDSTAPASTDWVVVTFELYFATFETVWYRVPTDDTTEEVLFRGIITQPPVISQASDQNIFGYSPVNDTTIGCVYDPEYLQELMYDITFNKGEVVVYHMAGDLDTANIVKIFTGVGGNHDLDDESVQINILDKSYILDQPVNNDSEPSAFDETVQPEDRLKPIPIYFGEGRQFRCTCIDFDNTSPTTSQNRKWAAFSNGHLGVGGGGVGNVFNNASSAFLYINGTGYNLSGLYTNSSSLSTSGTAGITLNNNIEATLGISTINPDSAFVVIFRNSISVDQAMNGNNFDVTEGVNSVRIIYHFLRAIVGLSEDEINITSFSTASSAITRECEVLIPDLGESEYPTIKEVISRLCATDFLRAFFDKDGKFKVKLIEPASATPDLELTDDDLIDVRFNYDTNDIYQVTVQFANGAYYGTSKSGTAWQIALPNEHTSTYTGATYLHGEVRTKTIKTYGYDTGSGLQDYIDKYGQLLGERRGLLSCFVKSGAYELELGDTVSISRKKQPGYEYDGTTENSRSYVVTEIRKQIDGVYLVLDDQKVIEENSGDW